MRKLSIYLTVFFFKAGVPVAGVTLLSILVGLLGAWGLWNGEWVWGILGVNGWYLLDHVDGELARLRQQTSATGLFFDTIANAIVPPVAFYALGARLSWLNGTDTWLHVGIVAAYACLMLLVVPYCLDSTLMSAKSRPAKTVEAKSESHNGCSAGKKIFMLLHKFVLYPVILPILTAGILITNWTFGGAELPVKLILASYAVVASVVWIGVLANTVISRKPDALLEK